MSNDLLKPESSTSEPNSLKLLPNQRKLIVSVLAGLLTLFFSKYGISVVVGQIEITLPWAMLISILPAMVFGRKYALVIAFSGGALYPFLIWSSNGYANVLNFILLSMLLVLVSSINYPKLSKNNRPVSASISRVLVAYIIIISVAYLFLFNIFLSLNPPFWTHIEVTELPFPILISFLIKDSINIFFLVITALVILSIPLVRTFFGLPVKKTMKYNAKLFIYSIITALLIWVIFILLDYSLLKPDTFYYEDYYSIAFLVLFYSSMIVTRILIWFMERRLEAEINLRKNKSLLQAILANTSDIIAILDISAKIQYTSPNIKKWFGWNPEDLINKSISESLHPNDIPEMLAHLDATIGHSEACSSSECRFLCSDNTYKWIEFTITNCLDQPDIQGVLLNYHDISRRKMIEEELLLAKNEAEASDRLKSAFLANLSHEIRTPMNAVIGFTDLILLNKPKEKVRTDYLDVIKKSGNHLLTIINDMIEISIIESGQVILNLDIVNLKNLTSEVYKVMSISIPKNKPIDFILNYQIQDSGYKIKIDEVKLRQILTNLLSNAIKFTDSGYVKFSCKTNNDSVIFVIEDTGIGIPAQYHKQIFERFHQVEGDHTIKAGGSGLGLAISKAYADLIGGSISVKSEPQKGSVFSLTIPINNNNP